MRIVASLLTLMLTVSLFAAGAPSDRAAEGTAVRPTVETTGSAIAWFGTWRAAAAEAKRTGRPIFLLSAAPQCHGVSGVW